MSPRGRQHRLQDRERWAAPETEYRNRGFAPCETRPRCEPEEVEPAANRALDEIEDRIRIVLAAGGEAALQARIGRLLPAAATLQAHAFTVRRSGPGKMIIRLHGEGSSVLAVCSVAAGDMAAAIIEAAKA